MRARPHCNPFSIFGKIEKPEWKTIFPNDNPLVVEIGFSNGRWLMPYAKDNPTKNIVGIEIRHKFVTKVQQTIEKEKIQNAHALLANANTAFEILFDENSIETVLVLFPDPWYKDKHIKRRVIIPSFVPTLASKMKKGSILHIASDQEDLARDMRDVLNNSTEFENLFEKDGWAPENIAGYESDIENFHIKHKNPIYRLQFRKKD